MNFLTKFVRHSLLISLLAAFLSTSGATKGSIPPAGDDPKAIFTAFYPVYWRGDWREIAKFVTKQDQRKIRQNFTAHIYRESPIFADILVHLTRYEIIDVAITENRAVVKADHLVPENFSEFFNHASELAGQGKTFDQSEKMRKWQRLVDSGELLAEALQVPQIWFLIREPAGWRIFLGFDTLEKLLHLQRQAERAEQAQNKKLAMEIYDRTIKVKHPFDFARQKKGLRPKREMFRAFYTIDRIRDSAARNLAEWQRMDVIEQAKATAKARQTAYLKDHVSLGHTIIKQELVVADDVWTKVGVSLENRGDRDIRYLLLEMRFENEAGETIAERRELLVNHLEFEGTVPRQLPAGESLYREVTEKLPASWGKGKVRLSVIRLELKED